jgi:putative transcriptional regulator
MKKELFNELVASIKEAGRIHRGEVPPSREFRFDSEDVRAIREKLNKSQSEFARMIGVSVSTLQNWEQGRRQPHGPARALLRVASRAPNVVAKALSRPSRRGGT